MANIEEVWNSIQFVIVLYKESLQNTKTFKSLESAHFTSNIKLNLFVYDNSPLPKKQNFIHNRFNIIYVSDINNSGLSKAYNKGFTHAITNNKKFVILLDQDTEFSNDFFIKYEQAVLNNQDIEIFAPKLVLSNGKIFSPCIYKYKRGWYPNEVGFGINKLKNLVPVNSGVMLSVRLYQKVGGYNEDLKVDFIDFQFMEKVINFTNEFYVIEEIGLQEFSDQSEDFESQLKRYYIYLADVKAIKKKITSSIEYFVIVIVHTLKLSIKYKSIAFFTHLIKA